MVFSPYIDQLFSNSYGILEMTHELLRLNDIKVTKGNLEDKLYAHPDFPSLLSVGDTLDRLGIENVAAKVSLEKTKSISQPFLILMKEETDEKPYFSLVLRSSPDHVTIKSPKKSNVRKLTWDQLEAYYQNVIFLIVQESPVIEKDYQINKNRYSTKQILTFVIPLFLLLSVGFSVISGIVSPLMGIHAIISILGIYISISILRTDLGQSSNVVQFVCGSKGYGDAKVSKYDSCGPVFNSKASSIFGLKLAEISFSYFSLSLFIYFTIILGLTIAKPFLFVTSSLASLFIIFSIYYQATIVKQWCKVCLLVQLLLFFQLMIVLLVGFQEPFQATVGTILSIILIIAIGGLIPLFSIISFSEHTKLKKIFHEKNREISELKYNREVFERVQRGQPRMRDAQKDIGIILGREGGLELVMVCNPNCGPCGNQFNFLNKKLDDRAISLRIIFTSSTKKSDPSLEPVQVFMDGFQYRKDTIRELLATWFASPEERKEILGKFLPKIKDVGDVNRQIEEMDTWCRNSKITFTPTFFINGFLLNEFYTLEEALFLLDN